MLSIGILSLDSLDYYLDLAAEDYYLKGGEPLGKWYGKGAKAFGLPEVVERYTFRQLFLGFHPQSGEPLVQNAGRTEGERKRRPGHDLTLSIPKDVSCFVATSIWETIRSIHDESTRDTLDLLEQTRAFVRRGSGSQNHWRLERASIVAALFEHTVSRELDPQLHTHALLLNLGLTGDGRFGALHSPAYFGTRQRHFLGAYYRALVAYRLREDLQLETYRNGTSFGVKGMPKSLVRERSKRRRQIQEYLKNKGWEGGAAAAMAAIITRRTKAQIPPREKLDKMWAKQNRAHGLTERTIQKMRRTKPQDSNEILPVALVRAVDNMSVGRVSHFTEIELQIEALQEAVDWGLHPKTVLDGLARFMKTSEEITSLGVHDNRERYTTRTILERERRLLGIVGRLRDASALSIRPKVVKKVLAKYRLTDEQREAVEYLVRSPGCIRLLDGRAGTGKTSSVLMACKEIWERHGYRVVAATHTGQAAVELEQATGIPTETIHWQLADFEPNSGFNFRHHLKQFWRAARKKRTYRLKQLKPVKVDRKTILVIDEAGMVNSRHWEMLTSLVERGGGTLVATGDSRQLPAVEGQSPFQSLTKRIGCAELKEIHRQKEEWAKEVARLMSEGNSGIALAILAERGYVKPHEDMDDALEMLVRDWSVRGVRQPERAPILASTNQEVEAINDLCQEIRLKAEVIGGKSANIAEEDETGQVLYTSRVFIGDRIVFTDNNRRLKVRNGFTGTVIGIDRFGRLLSVQLDGGDRIIVPVKKYRHIRRGYAMTVHKAQGGTYPECWVLAGPQQNLPRAYVSLSRAVLATHVYTSKELLDERLQNVEGSQLANEMRNMPDHRLASDLLERVWLDKSVAEPVEKEQLTRPTETPKSWWESGNHEADSRHRTPWWEKEGKPNPTPISEPGGRRERERVLLDHAKKRVALARAKQAHREREREEQRRYASGEWEREEIKRKQATARAALEKAKRQLTEQELEERRRYAMAQAEADQRRRALLTQLCIVTSSVMEPRRTQAGNRDLLQSSLTAMFNSGIAAAKTTSEEHTHEPIMASFLADLFTPPAKEVPETSEVEVVSVGEDDITESPIAAQDENLELEAGGTNTTELPQDSGDESRHSQPEDASDWWSSGSSSTWAQPDYTSSSGGSYQSSIDPFTECQTQSMAMATYQASGAAGTAALQTAIPVYTQQTIFTR